MNIIITNKKTETGQKIEVTVDREPMSYERFVGVAWIVVLISVLTFLLSLAAILN